MGRDASVDGTPTMLLIFQSTLPAWGETASARRVSTFRTISIHSPRMGRDLPEWTIRCDRFGFQSTLPAWGETGPCRPGSLQAADFNPLSPHGERRAAWRTTSKTGVFQSTLPAWGETILAKKNVEAYFISIHSPRMGRDPAPVVTADDENISIHSPRMGRDQPDHLRTGRSDNFNPLSPHGERQHFFMNKL